MVASLFGLIITVFGAPVASAPGVCCGEAACCEPAPACCEAEAVCCEAPSDR